MLNVADLARFSTQGEIAEPATETPAQPAAPASQETTADDDDFSTRPTAERPVFDDLASETVTARTTRKPGYALIMIIALISLLLLGATGYFVYSLYQKTKPPTVEQQPE